MTIESAHVTGVLERWKKQAIIKSSLNYSIWHVEIDTQNTVRVWTRDFQFLSEYEAKNDFVWIVANQSKYLAISKTEIYNFSSMFQ